MKYITVMLFHNKKAEDHLALSGKIPSLIFYPKNDFLFFFIVLNTQSVCAGCPSKIKFKGAADSETPVIECYV